MPSTLNILPSNSIKVGFVGLSSTGWASTVFAPSLIQASLGRAFDIVAVSTTSAASAQASADKYSKEIGHPVKAYFGDASKIAADPDVNLVAVAVGAPYHKSAVLRAIEAKKDFFIEWPAGASLKETKEIAAEARKQGVRSLVGLQVEELLSSEVIGTIRPTNVRFSHRRNLFPVGTVVDDEGKLTDKTYTSKNLDHFVITGFLKGAVLANLFWRVGYASSEGRRHFVWEIEGDEGSIRMESPVAYPSIYEPDLYLNGKMIEFDTPGDVMQSLGAAWKQFGDGGPGNYATIEEAVKNHCLIEAIEKSAKSGARVIL